MSSKATDQELLAAFYFSDDDDALAAFVSRHRSWALTQARQFFAEEAEDIVQLSILRLMDAQPVVEVRNPLGWWRTMIAMTAMDQLRAATRRRKQEREAGEMHRLESLYFVSRIEHAELIRHIDREVDRLDERFRGPLLKRYFEGMSYSEIARTLALSPGTVASRLSRGIGHVRDALAAQGLLPAYQQDQEATVMKPLPTATVERNRAFAEKWNDIWFVSLPKGACGIGHITTAVAADGSVIVKCRGDMAPDRNSGRRDRPEEADRRMWMSYELSLQDVERSAWSQIAAKRESAGPTGPVTAQAMSSNRIGTAASLSSPTGKSGHRCRGRRLHRSRPTSCVSWSPASKGATVGTPGTWASSGSTVRQPGENGG